MHAWRSVQVHSDTGWGRGGDLCSSDARSMYLSISYDAVRVVGGRLTPLKQANPILAPIYISGVAADTAARRCCCCYYWRNMSGRNDQSACAVASPLTLP